jgi:hypothetical protein
LEAEGIKTGEVMFTRVALYALERDARGERSFLYATARRRVIFRSHR